MSNIPGLEKILNETSQQIESYKNTVQSHPDDITPQEVINLQSVLKQSQSQITKTLTAKKPVISLSDKTLNRIWSAILYLQNEPTTQVKVGEVQTKLFYETVKEFQNLLEKLKIKRGEKAEKVDLGGL
jgi:hypothetical protein